MWLWVALAGGLGATLRVLVDAAVASWSRLRWPLGTLVVNVLGSFGIGVLWGLQTGPAALAPAWFTVVGTGFLGGFTTFSAASLEVASLLQSRRPAVAGALASAMVGACLLAVAAGVALTSVLT